MEGSVKKECGLVHSETTTIVSKWSGCHLILFCETTAKKNGISAMAYDMYDP